MKRKVHKLVGFMMVLIILSMIVESRGQPPPNREHQIKAAFLCNFIKFVDWPEEKTADSNKPIIVGIIGSEDFTKVFEPIKRKPIKNRTVAIKYFECFEESKESKQKDNSDWNRKIKAIRKCHLLVFSASDSTKIKNQVEIIEALAGSSVLTVGETPGFLEAGGIINFITEQKKVRFEINASGANRAKLKIRSQLLRLAKRVIE